MNSQRILICELVPNEKVNEFANVGQAANNYILNFTKACNFTKTFAFVPIQIEAIQNFEDTGVIKYFQVRWFKHSGVFKIANRLVESVKMLKSIFEYRKNTAVWFYNLTQHYFLIYIVAKYIYRCKVYVLLADLYLNEDKFTLNNYFIKLIEKSDGVISLSRGAEKLKIRHLSISNGIVSPVETIPNDFINKKEYLFSGVLSKMKGIDLALEAFSQMPRTKLLVSGIGPMLDLVKEYASKYPNIEYLGWMDYASYIQVLSRVSFCLSFRNPQDEENQYNFPSKIIEYFQYGKIVISTLDYQDIPDRLLIKSNFDINMLKEVIETIQNMEEKSLIALSAEIKDFVEVNFSYQAINKLVIVTEN